MTLDINLIRSLYTLCFFVSFVWLCFWAYSPKQKKLFDKAKMIPFSDNEEKTYQKDQLRNLNGDSDNV